MKMNPNKSNRYMPFLMALCIVIGIVIGTFYSNHFSGNRLSIINSSSNKLNNLLRIIDDQYVDPVDMDSLVEKAISGVTYTSASVSGNANIRAGGLAKINGVYYRIASVSGTTVTLDADSLSSVSSGNTAFFPYALSLRYKSGSSSEYYATGSGASTYTISSDDGDGVVESTTKSGTKYTWNLSVLSGAFDDGPISIV